MTFAGSATPDIRSHAIIRAAKGLHRSVGQAASLGSPPFPGCDFRGRVDAATSLCGSNRQMREAHKNGTSPDRDRELDRSRRECDVTPSALCRLPPAPALVAPARPAPSCSAPSCSAPRTEKPAPGRTRRRAVYQLVCEPKPASEPDRDPTATAWPTRHPDLNRTAPEGPPAGDLACGPGQAVRRPPDPTRSVSSQCLSAPLHRSTIRHRSSAVPLGTAFGVRSPAAHPQNASLSGRVRQHPGPKQDRLARVAPCRFP